MIYTLPICLHIHAHNTQRYVYPSHHMHTYLILCMFTLVHTHYMHTFTQTTQTCAHKNTHSVCTPTCLHTHTLMYTHIQTVHHVHTHTTLCVCILIHTQCTHTCTPIHMHILNVHPNINIPIVSIYTFIHTYTAHIQASHTCTHSVPSTLYAHIHVHLHSTLTHYEHAQAYTRTQPGGGTLHRPTACRHFTHSSQHLSCAVQTLRDPCPFSTCSSESHRAAVSGVCKGSIPAVGVEIGGFQTRMVGSSLASGLLRIPRGPSCMGRTDHGVSGAWRNGEDPNRGSFLNMSTV